MYINHITDVNKIAKMMNVSNADAFAVLQGTLNELTKIQNPTEGDILDAMISYVEKFKKITKLVQQSPDLLKLTQNNVMNSFNNLKSWEK